MSKRPREKLIGRKFRVASFFYLVEKQDKGRYLVAIRHKHNPDPKGADRRVWMSHPALKEMMNIEEQWGSE